MQLSVYSYRHYQKKKLFIISSASFGKGHIRHTTLVAAYETILVSRQFQLRTPFSRPEGDRFREPPLPLTTFHWLWFQHVPSLNDPFRLLAIDVHIIILSVLCGFLSENINLVMQSFEWFSFFFLNLQNLFYAKLALTIFEELTVSANGST